MALVCSLTIFLEPSFFDHASIADDADTWELEVLFAELNKVPQKFSFLMQERFSSREVDLLHTYSKIDIITDVQRLLTKYIQANLIP